MIADRVDDPTGDNIGCSRPAIKTGKRAFYEQAEMNLEDAYRFAAGVMTQNMLHAEANEGICAFLEKREPNWPK